MPENDFQQDAKLLYRRLDALFSNLPPDSTQRQLLRVFLDDLYATFRDDLRLEAVFLYQERRTRFSLVDYIGCIESLPSKLLHPKSLPVKLVFEHLVYIFPDPNRKESPTQNQSFPFQASAGMALGETPDRFLIFFVLNSGWNRGELDFLLNTVRAALGSRLVESRLRGTFREAAEIQKSLLPSRSPNFPGYDIASLSIPAEEVGGDFFDYYSLDTQILGFSIGDASGHGLPAALLVRDLVIGLRMGMEKEFKVTHVFNKLNRVIHRSRLSSRFVSLFYVEMEDNGNLMYVNAGHQPPLLFSQSTVQELTIGGTVIGPLAEVRFRRGFACMKKGDFLVAFTDGIIERRNPAGELFGVERLKEMIQKDKTSSASVLIDRIIGVVRDYGGGIPWEDDATISILKYNG